MRPVHLGADYRAYCRGTGLQSLFKLGHYRRTVWRVCVLEFVLERAVFYSPFAALHYLAQIAVFPS